MAAIEFPAELQKSIQESGPVDLVVGITGTAEIDALRAKTRVSLNGASAKTVITYAGDGDTRAITSSEERVRFAPYPMPSVGGSLAIWVDVSAAQRSILALAAAWQARACVVIHGDLAALDAETIRILTDPVLQAQCDLVMPVYPHGKYDGLMNKGILAPLSRALYGKRVRFPLAYEFCAGASVLTKLAEDGSARARNEQELLWPANAVAMSGGRLGEAAVNFRRAAQTDNVELSAVLSEFAGSLFQEAEMCAAQWQRVRGSQPVSHYGSAIPPEENAHPVDPRPMVESFVFGSHNLEEVWRLVLPPATMLDLKRLARMNVEQFRMPDALWARIIYDFALAHRMRRVSRSHALGALTPLYLGWVASYTQEVRGATAQEADHRIEQLARAYEEQKPYFVSRWRWPERAA
jgi:glucosylglycerate synthase